MADRLNKLLIIGAGPVGLGMAAALKAHAIPYEQVDASDGIGGNWRHGVYATTHIISSKRSTAYADYPMPADYPDFPSAAQMLAYLENYATARGLLGNIRLNSKVVKARPQPDDSWRVEFEGGEAATYKGVIVCNGHHWDRRYPDYPGSFAGEILHSKDYKQPADIAGKRVLVVGGGNSGCDMACEAARVGVSSDMSLRSGYWFLPKTAFGRPLTDLPIWNLPVPLQRLVLRTIVRITVGDYRRYGLKKPSHRLFERHPTFGTDLLTYLAQGRIEMRPDVSALEGRTVHFADGSCGEYDTIIYATGFNVSFPFLPVGLIEVKDNIVQVYGHAFPDKVKNLYVVGWAQPRNGFGTILTPAANLYARVIKLQDELEHPIGAILKWMDEDLPASYLVDPGAARREIWRSHYLLPYLRWQGNRMAAKEPRERIAPDARFDYEARSAPLVVY